MKSCMHLIDLCFAIKIYTLAQYSASPKKLQVLEQNRPRQRNSALPNSQIR